RSRKGSGKDLQDRRTEARTCMGAEELAQGYRRHRFGQSVARNPRERRSSSRGGYNRNCRLSRTAGQGGVSRQLRVNRADILANKKAGIRVALRVLEPAN